MKILLSYFIGFIIFLAFTCLFSNKGFRDRVFIAFLWFFWIGIAIIGMAWSVVDAFIHNCSIEESAEKIFDKKIFNWINKL
jgi:hypothetical protein